MNDKKVVEVERPSFENDMSTEYRRITKTIVKSLSIAIVICIACIVALTVYFTQKLETQAINYTASMERQNKEFIDYLATYDFSDVQIDAQQDGQGVNIVGGGDITNGADSKTP